LVESVFLLPKRQIFFLAVFTILPIQVIQFGREHLERKLKFRHEYLARGEWWRWVHCVHYFKYQPIYWYTGRGIGILSKTTWL